MTTDFEAELRERLRAHAETVTPDPRTWDRVQEGIRRGRRFRWLQASAGVAALAAVAAVAVLVLPGLLSEPRVDFATGPIPTEAPAPAPSAAPPGADPAIGDTTLVLGTPEGIAFTSSAGSRLLGGQATGAIDTVAVRPGFSGEPTDVVISTGCALQHARIVDGGTTSYNLTTPAYAACAVGPRFSPDGQDLAWIDRAEGSLALTVVGWDDEGEVPFRIARFTLDMSALAEVASVRVAEWVWVSQSGSTARGFLQLAARDGQGRNHLLTVEVERMGDGAITLSDPGPPEPFVDADRRFVAYQQSAGVTWTLAIDGAGVTSLRREDDGAQVSVLDDALPQGFADAGPVWLEVVGETAVFGDGLGQAWTVTNVDGAWSPVRPLDPGMDVEILHAAASGPIAATDVAPPVPTEPAATEPPPTSATDEPTAPTVDPTEPAAPATETAPATEVPSPNPEPQPDPEPDEGDLPAAVVAKREEIRAAAQAGDLEGLAALADPDEFTFSYGAGTDPAAFWQAEIDNGVDVLGQLLGVLDLPAVTHQSEGGPAITTWPFAYDRPFESLASAEYLALEAAVGSQVMETYEQTGQYLGYRVGIRADGSWIYLVAGD